LESPKYRAMPSEQQTKIAALFRTKGLHKAEKKPLPTPNIPQAAKPEPGIGEVNSGYLFQLLMADHLSPEVIEHVWQHRDKIDLKSSTVILDVCRKHRALGTRMLDFLLKNAKDSKRFAYEQTPIIGLCFSLHPDPNALVRDLLPYVRLSNVNVLFDQNPELLRNADSVLDLENRIITHFQGNLGEMRDILFDHVPNQTKGKTIEETRNEFLCQVVRSPHLPLLRESTEMSKETRTLLVSRLIRDTPSPKQTLLFNRQTAYDDSDFGPCWNRSGISEVHPSFHPENLSIFSGFLDSPDKDSKIVVDACNWLACRRGHLNALSDPAKETYFRHWLEQFRKAPDAITKVNAIHCMRGITRGNTTQNIANFLIDCLSDSEPAINMASFHVLQTMGTTILPILVEMIKSKNDPFLLMLSCQLICGMSVHGKDAGPVLEKRLLTANWREQGFILDGLCAIGYSTPVLLETFKSMSKSKYNEIKRKSSNALTLFQSD
jgi:hypothetical protein